MELLLEQTGIRKIDRDIVYYRSDLADAKWSVYIIKDIFKNWLFRISCYAGSFAIVFGIALTGGSMGQGAWLVLGMVIAYYRFKILLIIGPLMVALILMFVPAAKERFTQGLVVDESAGEEVNTSSETPFFGNGRVTMQRIGLSRWLGENIGKPFPHPHNAYMQLFLDSGFLLGMPILIFYIIVLRRSLRFFRDNRNTMLCAMGMALRFYQKREIIIKNNGDHSLVFEEEQELSKKKKILKGKSNVN